ncbi:MAG: glycosyltransferase [Propionibacteriales bacterium]|nr:glycosyltransferase [Propionibacteriales bacterium]
MTHSAPAASRPLVTAVLVVHDGARWLPRLLETLTAQRSLPDRIVVVDTGSTDDSRRLLESTLGPRAIVSADRGLAFGDAVRLGLEHLPPDGHDPAGEWLWILHDDCQLESDTLHHLLASVQADPKLSIVGPKVREWPRRKRLLEVGLTVSGTARRVTGVDSGEYDQGQHDEVSTRLAVASVGMLVRREAWDRLGGFDPDLRLFGEDVDFGWRAARAGLRTAVCSQAVVYHAEASARGQRAIEAVRGRPHRLAREHALYTVLVNSPAWKLPWLWLRLTVGSVLRALGLVLVKAPGAAADELVALLATWVKPMRLLRGRVRRRRAHRVPHSAVRPLLAPWWAPYRQAVDLVGQVVAEAVAAVSERTRRTARGAETGPVADEAQNLTAQPGMVTWLLGRPMALVAIGLAVLSLFGGVDVVGPGLLRGGALLPAAPGAADWWSLYGETWHPVSTGSDLPAPPYVAVLGGLATVLLGKAWLVVDLLIGFSVPLTALAAYALTRRLVRSTPVAIWAAVSYALLPVLTGAVSQGRLGTVVATMVAPLAARGLISTVRGSDQQRRWRAAVGAGLVLAVLTAFVPVALGIVAIVAIGVWLLLTEPSSERAWELPARLLVALVVPVVLLMPWLLELGTELSAWFGGEAGYGEQVAADPASRGDLLMGRPGGVGDAPGWVTVGLVLAALAALVRTDRRRGAVLCWLVAVGGLVGVLLAQRQDTWPGFALITVYGALVCAAALAGDGLMQRLTGVSFSWRQPVIAGVAGVAGLVPVASLAWWLLADPETLVERRAPVDFPVFMADLQQTPEAPRTLIIEGGTESPQAHLSREAGMFIGHDDVIPEPPEELLELVARLTSDPSAEDVRMLADHGVGFILLRSSDPVTVSAIDSGPGLTRAGAQSRASTAWRLDVAAGSVRIVEGNGLDGGSGAVLPSSTGAVHAELPEGKGERSLVVGEREDPGWRATLDGDGLTPVTVDGWGQGFQLPEGSTGELVVEHDSARGRWLAGQMLVLVLVVLMCLPGRRVSRGAL